jgi:hypothetical protein
MRALKHYLETQGAGLATSGQYLPYYALPYVPQPHLHPSFKHMFTDEWVSQQRATLAAILDELPSSMQLPMLYRLFESYTAAQAATGGGGAQQSYSTSSMEGLHTVATVYASQLAEGRGKALAHSLRGPTQLSNSATEVATSTVADSYSRPVSALLQGQVQLQDFVPVASAACLEGLVVEGTDRPMALTADAGCDIAPMGGSWAAVPLSTKLNGSQGLEITSPAAAAAAGGGWEEEKYSAAGPADRAKTAAVGFRSSQAGAAAKARGAQGVMGKEQGNGDSGRETGEAEDTADEQYSEDYEMEGQASGWQQQQQQEEEEEEGAAGDPKAEEEASHAQGQAADDGVHVEGGGVSNADADVSDGGGPSVLRLVAAAGDPSIVELGLAEMSSMGVDGTIDYAVTAAGAMATGAESSIQEPEGAVASAAAAAAERGVSPMVAPMSPAAHLKQCQEECTELAVAGLLAPLNYQPLQKDLRVSTCGSMWCSRTCVLSLEIVQNWVGY